MTDPDADDMEELEARLYGQVHHGVNEPEELPSYRPPASEAEPPGKRFDRYFEKKPDNMQYQSPFNRNPPFFQSNHNLFNTPENFYKNFRLVPLTDLVLNPAVNNIVVFPQPPTQIFTQQNPPPDWNLPSNLQKSAKKKKKKKGFFQKLREKRKQKKLERRNKFREHYMTLPAQRTGLLDSNGDGIENKVFERSVEVICLSESDNSDCEAIQSEKDESVVILSSDDENKNCQGSATKIKHESVEIDERKLQKLPQTVIKTCVDDNKRAEPGQAHVAPTEDDEVIYVEPAERREIISIDCDDSQTFPVEKSHTETSVVSTEMLIHEMVISEMVVQEQTELLETPESTNDFLDSTLSLNKNNDDDLNATKKADLDTCETESSCSTNDCATPSRSAIFNEEVFDSPSKNLPELNFDSFTNYIATKATPTHIPSILTPVKSTIGLKVGKLNKSGTNSSDSSSESDYEDSKSAYVDKQRLAKATTKKKSSESAQTKKAPLPNLSPMTSDEEFDVADLTASKSPQKKQNLSKPSASKQVCGEKRKSDAMESPEPSKKPRPKQINSEQQTVDQSAPDTSKDPMESPEPSKKPPQNQHNSISQQILKKPDSDTSESSDSEVEIVPPIDLDSSNCGSDIELVNIESASSPINVPQENNNMQPKRFSDYWTDDMKKFYFETWNGENFSVEEEQRKMTDDPKFWKISPRDRVNVNSQPKGPRCQRCREFGHRSHNCKKKMGPPKCILCGARGHLEARCPNKVCTSCGRRSHYSTTYCSRCANSKYARCKICLVRGHTSSNCTDLWRRYHLTCGRRSQYSTTYCSRCANSRYARCRICLVRGHTSSNCTDLWRRYHLTTTDGPIVQPTNTNMKASRDRWCSGCAFRGHFEFECNYYNRTHPPTNPFIHSYDEVYSSVNASHRVQKRDNSRIAVQEVAKKHGSDEPRARHIRWGDGEDCHGNIRPLMSVPVNFETFQIYPYSQAPNILQPDSSFQFPLYNSIVTPVAQPSNTPSGAETMMSHAAANVEDFGGSSNNPTSHNSSKEEMSSGHTIILPSYFASKLLKADGAEFRKTVEHQTFVKITVDKRIVNKNPRYVVTFNGPDDQILHAKDAIDSYMKTISKAKRKAKTEAKMKAKMKAKTRAKEITFGKRCTFRTLKKNIKLLKNPLIPWNEIANVTYNEVKNLESQMTIEKNRSKKLTLEKELKFQYTVLNALILGKLKVADGPYHMYILEQGAVTGYGETWNRVCKSFNYVFRNEYRLNMSYLQAVQKLGDLN